MFRKAPTKGEGGRAYLLVLRMVWKAIMWDEVTSYWGGTVTPDKRKLCDLFNQSSIK